MLPPHAVPRLRLRVRLRLRLDSELSLLALLPLSRSRPFNLPRLSPKSSGGFDDRLVPVSHEKRSSDSEESELRGESAGYFFSRAPPAFLEVAVWMTLASLRGSFRGLAGG